MDRLITVYPGESGSDIKEYEVMLTSVAKPYLYPGQTFKDAVNDRVMIKFPGYDSYSILFTHVIVYIFINLIIVMFLCCSFIAGFFLMMHHGVYQEIFKKKLNTDGMIDYYKENMGKSGLKVLGLITARVRGCRRVRRGSCCLWSGAT